MTRATPPVRNDHPLEADIILPEQFFPATCALGDPERRLRLAILEDALRYYQLYANATDRRARALYEDAADWLASPDRTEPFTFENVCDALGLDPHYIRRGLQRWRDTALASGAPTKRTILRERVRRAGPGGSGGSHRCAA